MAEVIEILPGFYGYDSLPEAARTATKNDFYDDRGRLKVGMWFLIHGYHDNLYEAYQVKKNFDLDRIKPWLEDGRVYIKEDKKPTE